MTCCSECGNSIRFIKIKKDKTKIAVDATPIYFLPPNGSDTTEWFVNADGYLVKGRRARDGMTGYKRHECAE